MNFRCNLDEDSECIDIKIESWCTPKADISVDYERHIRKILKRFKQMTFNKKDIFNYDDEYIIDLDIRSSGVKYGKKSYMACQLMLFKTVDSIKIQEYIEEIDKIIEADEYLIFTKNKKKVVS